jgi:hypothetical protein
MFCNTYPVVGTSASLRLSLPFGLPELTPPNLTCEGLFLQIGSLNATFSALMPLIKLAGCVLKIIELIKTVPEMVGPPPKPQKFFQKLAELDECITLISAFALILELPKLLKFLKQLLTNIIAVLNCIKELFQVTLANGEQIEILNASADAQLQEMGACLQVQNDALGLELQNKLDGMKLVLDLVNILLTLAGQPTISVGDSDFTPEVLDDTITLLTAARDAIPG